MRLIREIRFSVGPDPAGPVLNSWAGWPAATGIQPYLRLRACVEGQPHPVTGYLCNIKEIDSTLRDQALPILLQHAVQPVSCEILLGRIAQALARMAPAGTRWCTWELFATPHLRYAMDTSKPTVRVTQSFEFSASHRLHVPSISDEENRRVFGKCNNPSGHGHNYQLEVTVAGEPGGPLGIVFPLNELERIVKERVVDRLDHKHLNTDCPELEDLNPSVENIARVIWSLLEGRFAPARLDRVRVWETAKTYAEYGAT
jgi:6-pyruvoyltetrahydropterin/6-carboxytetrahydropterin synthase